MQETSLETLVREFLSATLRLSSQIQAGLAEPVDLDPIRAVVLASMYGLIDQGGEVNGVKFWRHGLGAMLKDGRTPMQIPGKVDVDIKLGRDPEGSMSTFYEIRPHCVQYFARSLDRRVPSEMEFERACISLVDKGVLLGSRTPTGQPDGRWTSGRWWIRSPLIDRRRNELGDAAPNLISELRRFFMALNIQVKPRRLKPISWDDVGFVEEPF
jgi:hypothetical protein